MARKSKLTTIYNEFSTALLSWYDLHGRKDLPWQSPRDPYRVWISEIMLQQTQVQTVLGYFNRFMQKFPDVHTLAEACDDEVLALWSGLGYYSRARNLHLSAKIISEKYQGIFPQDLELLIDLPGIGPSTAAAILSQAYNLPTAILDANVKRVLARFFMIKGWPEQSAVKQQLWELARACMPEHDCANYTQAIMDLGATCCSARKPDCYNCPVQSNCLAFKHQEQLQYPSKKIKKPIPTQQQQLLVLTNIDGQIYLEKRPPTGLWGGLWCFPSLDLDDCPLGFIKVRYALQGDEPQPLIAFKHSFSHFHLEITALSIKTKEIKNQVTEPAGKWFSKDQLTSLGLAKPTSIILDQLR